jgi:hypothetical protein
MPFVYEDYKAAFSDLKIMSSMNSTENKPQFLNAVPNGWVIVNVPDGSNTMAIGLNGRIFIQA